MQLLKLCARSLSSRELEAELKTWNSETQTSLDYMKIVSTFRTFGTAGPFPDMVASCLWVFRWNRILLDPIVLYVLSFVDFHIKTREPCFMFCFFFPNQRLSIFCIGEILKPQTHSFLIRLLWFTEFKAFICQFLIIFTKGRGWVIWTSHCCLQSDSEQMSGMYYY